jgi:mono/diheme cytochrome c family protein
LKKHNFINTLLNSRPLSNPIDKTDFALLLRRVALQVLAILLVVVLSLLGAYQISASEPYIKTVLSLEGDSTQGKAIFQMNCAGCHGADARGLVGPSLWGISDRKSRVHLIKQVIGGKTPPMPQFQPSPEIMAHLLKYLETL